MKSNYVLTPAHKTKCSECHGDVVMLMDEDMDPQLPAFYICFACWNFAEIGVGPVYTSSEITRPSSVQRVGQDLLPNTQEKS